VSEFERIARLRDVFGESGALVGIGDDAAVLATVAEPLVWTVDAQVDGTHFRLDWLTWEDVGWRSFMAAASDVAAMAAEPVAALSSLVLADDVDDAALDALARGQAAAAREVGAPIVGGNMARGRETSITTTVLGRASSPITRSGARAGDGLYLAGAVGKAGAGLAALMAGGSHDPETLQAWRRPRALVREGLAMRGIANAAIDISDGLAADAWHMAEASRVVLVFDEAALRAFGPELRFVLGGGEDYALLASGPSPIPGFTRVGRVERGEAGVMLDSGERLERSGFDHFG
jgi:thiamine-monophosphate kinase